MDMKQLQRIERAIARFFGRSEPIDQHELAMEILATDANMALSVIRLRCISAARSAQRHREIEQSKHSDILARYPDAKDEVNKLTATLTPSQRHLLYLRFWRGLGIDAIALELQWTSKSVRKSLRYILHQLRLASIYSLNAQEVHSTSNERTTQCPSDIPQATKRSTTCSPNKTD